MHRPSGVAEEVALEPGMQLEPSAHLREENLLQHYDSPQGNFSS